MADFEREVDEIDYWYRKGSNGEVVVRTKANKVIDTYRLLVALEYDIRQTWHQLNFVVAHTREQMPLVEDEIRLLQDKLGKIIAKLKDLQQGYEKEHDQLTKKISACDVRLGDVRKKRKYYEEIHIKDMIALDAQEPKFLLEKEKKEEMLRALQEQYRDVTEKYRALYMALDAEWAAFDLSLKEDTQRQRDVMQAERDNGAKLRDKRKKTVEEAYDEWLAKSDERMTVLQENCNRTDKRLSELQFWHPMKEETEACKKTVNDLLAQEHN